MLTSGEFTRRGVMLAGTAALLSGCAWRRRRLPPVVIGGNAVSPTEPVMTALSRSSEHTLLVEALLTTGLHERLAGIGPVTIFAPTDAALQNLRPKSEAARFAEDQAYLKYVLEGHIVPAEVSTKDIRNGIPQIGTVTKVFPLNSAVISLRQKDGVLRIFDTRGRFGRVGASDAIASNGLIHVIDDVVLPPEGAVESP